MQGISLAANSKAISIRVVTTKEYSQWQETQSRRNQQWLQVNGFKGENNKWLLLPSEEGTLSEVIFVCDTPEKRFSGAELATALPTGNYVFNRQGLTPAALCQLALSWGLAQYQFKRYRRSEEVAKPCLHIEETERLACHWLEVITIVRDLINTPTEDLGPEQLADYCREFCQQFSGTMREIVGDALLTEGYPLIHAVGRSSDRAPRLIDLRFGRETDPVLVLIGKGVCFDSGGLDIKTADTMALMKKDMGGAAHALGLAHIILLQKLPIQLRILIPAVENVISSQAYKPGDIFVTRNGLSVEIGNTDAEGRLILADALVEAASKPCKLVIDFATLTGAARVALGPDIPVYFCENKTIQNDLQQMSEVTGEWLWPLPLYPAYKEYIKSPFADLNNSGNSRYAGAITAALFLQAFAPQDTPWIHFDIMAYNVTAQPGRPQGGEAMGLVTVLEFIKQYFGKM